MRILSAQIARGELVNGLEVDGAALLALRAELVVDRLDMLFGGCENKEEAGD